MTTKLPGKISGMARDGLLPERLASVHPRFRTPHVVTAFTGVVVTLAAAFLPVGKLADYSNSGTLFAFAMVALSVLVLRRTDPNRRRPFRTPAVGIIAPAAILGCIGLYAFLPPLAQLVLIVWGAIGLLIYFGYSRSRSHAERLCEGVAIIASGKVVFDGSVADARGRLRPIVRLRTRASDGPWRTAIPSTARREGDEFVFELPEGGPEPLLKSLIDGGAGIETLAIERPGLHDAFVAIAGNQAAAAMGTTGAGR